MTIGVILPHTKLYGGVKRFLELGNIFIDKGHDFILFTQKGDTPNWFSFKGQIKTFSDISNYTLDALFFTEVQYLDLVSNATARHKIFYFVRGNDNLKPLKQNPEIEFFANSTNMYLVAKKKFNIEAFKAFGGINTEMYRPKEIKKAPHSPFTIMAYGRLREKKKGTMIVVKACELLYKRNKNIQLILFDTPVDDKMKKSIEDFHTKVPYEFITHHPVEKNPELFRRADVFIAPEKRAGWANTAVEAMASGVAVIATTSGTADFLFHEKTGLVCKRNRFSIARAIKRLMHENELRLKLAKGGLEEIQDFNWKKLANHIEKHILS